MRISGLAAPIVRRAIILLGLASLSACAGDPQLIYAPPPGLTAQNGASITGSLTVTKALEMNMKVYLAAVDNKMVPASSKGWNAPILVTPGLHVLQVMSCECGFWGNFAGTVSLAANLAPGQSYVLRSTAPASHGIFHPEKFSTWVEDSAGRPVTPPAITPLLNQNQTVYMPIFVK